MPVYRCGEHEWSNLDTLVRDASSAHYWKDVAQNLQKVMYAIAQEHPGLRISEKGLHTVQGSPSVVLGYDHMTREYVFPPKVEGV